MTARPLSLLLLALLGWNSAALAWLLHRGPDIVPIPGTKRRKYLEENVGAADVSLSAKEMAALDAALAPEKVSGPRYSEKQMAQVDR
jgi:diketogulonate reductase-like aldo/keto reductase